MESQYNLGQVSVYYIFNFKLLNMVNIILTIVYYGSIFLQYVRAKWQCQVLDITWYRGHRWKMYACMYYVCIRDTYYSKQNAKNYWVSGFLGVQNIALAELEFVATISSSWEQRLHVWATMSPSEGGGA